MAFSNRIFVLFSLLSVQAFSLNMNHDLHLDDDETPKKSTPLRRFTNVGKKVLKMVKSSEVSEKNWEVQDLLATLDRPAQKNTSTVENLDGCGSGGCFVGANPLNAGLNPFFYYQQGLKLNKFMAPQPSPVTDNTTPSSSKKDESWKVLSTAASAPSFMLMDLFGDMSRYKLGTCVNAETLEFNPSPFFDPKYVEDNTITKSVIEQDQNSQQAASFVSQANTWGGKATVPMANISEAAKLAATLEGSVTDKTTKSTYNASFFSRNIVREESFSPDRFTEEKIQGYTKGQTGQNTSCTHYVSKLRLGTQLLGSVSLVNQTREWTDEEKASLSTSVGSQQMFGFDFSRSQTFNTAKVKAKIRYQAFGFDAGELNEVNSSSTAPGMDTPSQQMNALGKIVRKAQTDATYDSKTLATIFVELSPLFDAYIGDSKKYQIPKMLDVERTLGAAATQLVGHLSETSMLVASHLRRLGSRAANLPQVFDGEICQRHLEQKINDTKHIFDRVAKFSDEESLRKISHVVQGDQGKYSFRSKFVGLKDSSDTGDLACVRFGERMSGDSEILTIRFWEHSHSVQHDVKGLVLWARVMLKGDYYADYPTKKDVVNNTNYESMGSLYWKDRSCFFPRTCRRNDNWVNAAQEVSRDAEWLTTFYTTATVDDFQKAAKDLANKYNDKASSEINYESWEAIRTWRGAASKAQDIVDNIIRRQAGGLSFF